MSRLKKGTIAAAVAISLIGGFEGYRSTAYQDVIGVWTACQGLTKGIKKGMTFTKSECDAKFIAAIQEHEEGMRGCLKTPDAIPIRTYIAMVSLTYNIGVGGFCKSSLPRKLDQKLYSSACETLDSFNKAGGKIWAGLTNRRNKEKAFCNDTTPLR
jgi:lysozyme